MKNIISKFLIIITLFVLGFIIFNPSKKTVDYPLMMGNELMNMSFQNNTYKTQLSNLTQYDLSVPASFEKVAENDHLILYLEEATLAIAIKDKANGYIWSSYNINDPCLNDALSNDCESPLQPEVSNPIKAGVSIYTFNQYSPAIRTGLDQEVITTYEFLVNGFKATLDFTTAMIKFDVYVKLDQEDLLINIPHQSISEYNPKLWQPGNTDISLNRIQVFPFLGSTKMENNGYIVIPDGSGAIVSLAETPRYRSEYRATIYGEDPGYNDVPQIPTLKVASLKPLSRITLPIYGIIHDVGNTGILVISESGNPYAIYNYESKGIITDYYQSYFSYTYRSSYNQYQSRDNSQFKGTLILGYQKEVNSFDLQERIKFLSNTEASYVGLAKEYRNYLEKNNQFSNMPIKQNELTNKIDIIGNEVEMGIFSQQNKVITKYNEALELIKTLQQDGYNNLDVTFKTFNLSDSAYRFDVYNNLGGSNKLKEMVSYLNSQGIPFSYYVNYINNYNNNKYTARMMSRKALMELNFSYMFAYSYINDVKYMNQFINEDLVNLNKHGIHSLSIAGLNSALYTHNSKGTVHYRTENMQIIEEALRYLDEKNIQVNLYNPDSYLYQYTNKYYDAPLSSSEMMFVDATIPLVELVGSGYMEFYSPHLNFSSNDVETLLRMVEYGVNPAYVLTKADTYDLKYTNSSSIYVSQYEFLKNRMALHNDFLKEAFDAVGGYEMINHEFIKEGVTLSEYANGRSIIVNYTNMDTEYNGTIIKARGYVVYE